MSAEIKAQLIQAFQIHASKLSVDEREAWIEELRKNVQSKSLLFAGDDCCCVLGALAKSKGISCYAPLREIIEDKKAKTMTLAAAYYLDVPIADCAADIYGHYPAMVMLNDKFNLSFADFIILIKETL